MKKKSILVFIIFLGCLASFSITAQSVILYPDDTNTLWYNLEEWIFSNANIPFRTYDFGTYEAYNPGFDNGINKDFIITIDGTVYTSSWLNNDFVTLPNLSFSDIDSVVINFNEFENATGFLPTHQINIFTKKTDNFVSAEIGRLNQINDPGMFGTSKSPNVEFINFPTNVGALISSGRYRSSVFLTWELYSRTNQLGYDQEIQPELFNRTQPPEQGSEFDAQRNHQQNILLLQSFTEQDYNISFLAGVYRSEQFYEWHRLSGIEALYSLNQYQVSAGFENTSDNGIYKSTNINFSTTTSDTLDYETPSALSLSEHNISQVSVFKLPVKSIPATLSLHNHYYSVEDNLTKSSYDHHSYSFQTNWKFNNGFKLTTLLGNDVQSVSLNKAVSDQSSIQLSTANQNIGNSFYNYSFFNHGIGFSNLESGSHRVINNSDFREAFSQVKWISSFKTPVHRFNGFAFFRHYWKLSNEFIQYSPDGNSLQLNTDLSYSDSENVGLAGIHAYLTSEISKKLKLKTMLSGNLSIYENGTFRNHYKSVPVVTFSESIQYTSDKNFVMELFYKYIPERTFYEYDNLEQSNGYPPVNGRYVSLLNFSSKMWFINRMLELKFTLRNLLNSTEAYDTNGQYYNMSVYVSGRVNLNFRNRN